LKKLKERVNLGRIKRGEQAMRTKTRIIVALCIVGIFALLIASAKLYNLYANSESKRLERFNKAYIELSLSAEGLAQADAELAIAKAEKAYKDASSEEKGVAYNALLEARKMAEPEAINKKVLEQNIAKKARECANMGR